MAAGIGCRIEHMARTDRRREEFAAFLRTRRARLTPSEVGLPAGTRRRVAGLRREEVAQLAGVGLTWYTWLEQGRPIAASEQVLTALARALRLTDDERDHLFALAGVPIPDRAETSCLRDGHLLAIEKFMPFPAAVQTARFDILAYNRAYRFLFGDLDRIEPERRNCALLLFTDPVWQRSHADLAFSQARIAARLRAGFGRHHDEPHWQQFIEELQEASPAFRALWERGDVTAEPNAPKHIRHAGLGELNLTMTSLWLDESLGPRLVWFAPADDPTAAKVTQLGEMGLDQPPVSAVAS